LAERDMGTEAMIELRESDSVLTADQIAEVVVDVITDTTKAGEIIQVTASDGPQWVDLTPRT
jgi:hypothetical protein